MWINEFIIKCLTACWSSFFFLILLVDLLLDMLLLFLFFESMVFYCIWESLKCLIVLKLEYILLIALFGIVKNNIVFNTLFLVILKKKCWWSWGKAVVKDWIKFSKAIFTFVNHLLLLIFYWTVLPKWWFKKYISELDLIFEIV